MNLFEFQLLEDPEKIDFIYKYGLYIGKRKKGKETLILFQVESFYVELTYNRYRLFVKKFHCFSSTNNLDPYLDQIKIEDLLGKSINR
jgi:hypothetical protein